MVKEIYFDPDEQYLLYQIYPDPEDHPEIKDVVNDYAEYQFVGGNVLYFIVTEETYRKIKDRIPSWTRNILKKTPISAIDDIVESYPSKKEIFRKAGIWKPPKLMGVGPGRKSKRKRKRCR